MAQRTKSHHQKKKTISSNGPSPQHEKSLLAGSSDDRQLGECDKRCNDLPKSQIGCRLLLRKGGKSKSLKRKRINKEGRRNGEKKR